MRILRIGIIFTAISSFAAMLQIYKDREFVAPFICSITDMISKPHYCGQLEKTATGREETQAIEDARQQQAIKEAERRRLDAQMEAEAAERHKLEAQKEAEAAEARKREAEQKAEAARQQAQEYSSSPKTDSDCEALLVKRTYQKPSIDCNKTNEPIEDLICADAELSAWDSAMAEAYRRLLQRSSDGKRIRNSQREFLNRRLAECRLPRTGRLAICDLAQAKPCVLRMTEERTIQLQNN